MCEPVQSDPPKRKRRWFQFSLRSLMIFTLICGVALRLARARHAQERRERAVVNEIVKDL